ncbi:DUF3630 family protein [Alteromonas sp. AMM-1]|uniref:DUF3630 family protein n=1 Tax=Alteromonas sp. AMM-1 TaxID=3394233 RepID=UPI0039A5E0F9
MQQLTQSELYSALRMSPDGLLMIDLPLPTTPLAFTRLCDKLGTLLGKSHTELEWGADRAQARYSLHDMDLLLQAEWLCEAMWLTPSGYAHGYPSAHDALSALLSRVASG